MGSNGKVFSDRFATSLALQAISPENIETGATPKHTRLPSICIPGRHHLASALPVAPPFLRSKGLPGLTDGFFRFAGESQMPFQCLGRLAARPFILS
jgi:hypothetical protein